MSTSPLHLRLREVTEGVSFRTLAEVTGVHAENVRRYMLGQSPSIEFLAGICGAFNINADWLLTGRGPRSPTAETRASAVDSARPGEILAAIAESIERLQSRLDRVETYVLTLEARLRAEQENPGDAPSPPPRSRSARAKRVADALPRRRPQDGG
ncbi:MAG: helix-turn-helix transcriptional regulator [Phycisphaerales bacterium]|nr:helix-turn-helix transcriptional regulator [Phycisphaerales bacterium]